MERFKVDRGYTVSLDREEVRKIGKRTILVVPAYKFLLNQSRVL